MRILIAAAVPILLAGCMTGQEDSDRTLGGFDKPGTATVSDAPAATETPREVETERGNRFEERWSCKGMSLTATCGPDDDPHEQNGCWGTVKVGDFPPRDTLFWIKGVQRIWNWCLDLKDFGYDCTVVMHPNNIGGQNHALYYDFSNVPFGESTKASSSTWCEKARSW